MGCDASSILACQRAGWASGWGFAGSHSQAKAPSACISHVFLVLAAKSAHRSMACLFHNSVERAAAEVSFKIRVLLAKFRTIAVDPIASARVRSKVVGFLCSLERAQ